MTLADIKEFRDSVRGKIPYMIICDNQQIFIDGGQESLVLWFDDDEKLIAIRPNPTASQAGYPFEVVITEYEHIQFIKVYANAEILKDILDASNHPNKDKAYNYCINSSMARVSVTGSTGDGISWLGTNPNDNINPHKPESKSE